MFRGKKYSDSAKLIDRSVQYEVADAMALVVKTAKAKFDETVEVHIKLGVDSRHADQQVRGAIVLPNGTGKTRKVLVFAKDAKLQEALDAGADYAGGMSSRRRPNSARARSSPFPPRAACRGRMRLRSPKSSSAGRKLRPPPPDSSAAFSLP